MIEHKIECKIEEAKRNWKTALSPNAAKISGHTYKVEEIHDNVTVVISKCEHCGEISISWAEPGPMIENTKRLSGFPYNKIIANAYSEIKNRDM